MNNVKFELYYYIMCNYTNKAVDSRIEFDDYKSIQPIHWSIHYIGSIGRTLDVINTGESIIIDMLKEHYDSVMLKS